MRVTGIIAEYNPFHRGHEYHLAEARKLTGADYVVVVMSGDFTQRGAPAVMDKYSRARQALMHGADLVLELPVCFATASAQYFAYGGISLLHRLGVVDTLVFGSEEGSLAQMQLAADFLRQEPEAYRISLQQYIKQGYSYPKARAMALEEHLPQLSADFLSLPNNILGIDYLRGIQHFHSTITPITLSRKDNRYHDTVLSGENRFSSATAIRQAMYTAWAQKEPVPAGIDELPTDCWGRSMPIFSDDFSALLQYKLWLEEGNDLSVFSDVNPQLADRIKNRLNDFTTVENFCDLLKTKELTHSRIRRGLLHICLEMREEDLHRAVENGYTPYARILGFRREAAPLLHGIKENACISLISKLADARSYLDEPAWSMLETEIKAAHIYETVVSRKFGTPFCNEYRRQLVIC